MRKSEIYANRFIIGNQLLRLVIGEGYTKSSFSKMVAIEKDMLDNMLMGSVDDEDAYINLLNVILTSLDADLETILAYKSSCTEKPITKEQSVNEEILDNVLDLYDIYV